MRVMLTINFPRAIPGLKANVDDAAREKQRLEESKFMHILAFR